MNKCESIKKSTYKKIRFFYDNVSRIHEQYFKTLHLRTFITEIGHYLSSKIIFLITLSIIISGSFFTLIGTSSLKYCFQIQFDFQQAFTFTIQALLWSSFLSAVAVFTVVTWFYSQLQSIFKSHVLFKRENDE